MSQALLLEKQFVREKKSVSFAIERLKEALSVQSTKVYSSVNLIDAAYLIKSNVAIDCLILTKSSDPQYVEDTPMEDEEALKLILLLHERRPYVPIFLLSDDENIAQKLNLDLFEKINEFIFILKDTLEFVVGRITFRMKNYKEQLFPPLLRAMQEHLPKYEYSWGIPGHRGGVGLRKTPAGRAFFDFFGEHVFEADWDSVRAHLGSLLGHFGPFGESEANTARIFGSNMSFSGVVGSSGSNRTVMQYCIKEDEPTLVDRNCHKSITYGLILTGAKPIYMKPTRNIYSIIGPIGIKEMENAVIKAAGSANYGVVTNCTPDGICYNSEKIEKIMENLAYVHFDEAWFAHARFNPMYDRMYCMRGDPNARIEKAKNDDSPLSTLFSVHSTHKMLNGLGQASNIHVRNGNKSGHEVVLDKFNQYYMMHTTTSPSYILAASNDIAAHMMDGENGLSITRKMITEAVNFRQSLARLYNDFYVYKEWFFKPWNPEKIDGVPFENFDTEELITKQKYWMLRSEDEWHGFGENLDDDWVMLDPVKVSVLTPGINIKDNSFEDVGVPAPLVCAWLAANGIVPYRYTDFQILFLFTSGITKGKWGTLIDNFLQFKQQYDKNTPLKYALPDLYAKHADFYQPIGGLRDLSNKMFLFLQKDGNNLAEMVNEAFENLPELVYTPKQAFQHLTSTSSEYVYLDALEKRIAATAVIPYPPGIPLIMPGERFGKVEDPHIRYLKALERWDHDFPGFEHETTGVQLSADGRYKICVLASTY